MKLACRIKRTFAMILALVALLGFVGCCSEHDWETISEVQVTCESEGMTVFKCRECGEEETVVFPVTDHDFTEKILQEASCKSEGVAQKNCSACGKVEEITIEKIPHAYEVISVTESTFETAGVEESICSVCGDIGQKELPKLGAYSNPAKITVEQLVFEIYSSQDAAKAKYNDQWVEITGTVLDADNVAGMTRFCLYGKIGDSGLRIVCWVNREILKPFDYQGQTITFRGQVREIATLNATEIGNCTIISE